MLVLGIETTCDETGAAVVEDGRRVLSNVVASSADLQKKYGGVVPEVAAREQVRIIIPVIEEAIGAAARLGDTEHGTRNKLSSAEIIDWARESIDAIAVAHGPGLIGSLLIGVETAKTLALVWDKPLIAVNHLVGHIYANFFSEFPNSKFQIPKFPAVGLIVSGGHTDLVLMTDHGKFQLLGSTLDDAAGEAFDKVAKLLGLGYPGGPEIEKQASRWKVESGKWKVELPRPLINSRDFNFSFSGLKTAVVNVVHNFQYSSSEKREVTKKNTIVTGESSHSVRTINDDLKSQIAYEFQQAVVDVLVKKAINAAKKYSAKSIVVGGGVAANSELRSRMSEIGLENSIDVLFPSKRMSVDNGAMIAAAAFYKLLSLRELGELNFKRVDPLKLSADPGLHF